MKQSHLISPRTLSDCTFEVGYPEAAYANRVLSYLLAFSCGFMAALVWLYWLGP